MVCGSAWVSVVEEGETTQMNAATTATATRTMRIHRRHSLLLGLGAFSSLGRGGSLSGL